MTTHTPWTDDENAAVVALYFDMLDHATAGKPYNKAAMIRKAQAEPLANRSKGSIEAKLMNCTTAHRDLMPNAETMNCHGYRALSHYQASLKSAIYLALTSRMDIKAGVSA